MENILSSQTLVSLFFARLFTIDEAPTPTFFLYKNPGKLVLLSLESRYFVVLIKLYKYIIFKH
jgi:hypothetical protein